jgi:hypothetical protein
MIAQILIAPNIGGCILGAFLTGIVTLVAYEASKKEWITLTAALAMSISCVLIGFLPDWIIMLVLVIGIIYLAYDKKGKW